LLAQCAVEIEGAEAGEGVDRVNTRAAVTTRKRCTFVDIGLTDGT
jgi:hypothetical protein